MQTPPPAPPSPMSSVEVDRAIWRAVAGATVTIPAVNSFVYYFPQGHLEQCSHSDSAVKNHNFDSMSPLIPCQVISLRFLSDPVSDQVYTKILLQPLRAQPERDEGIGGGADDDDVVSFAKILTRSDANNGGGFSVPRFCADMVLPQLNFAADPPVQNLVMRDTRNHAWEFRHIYRGTPRRHLLTTGWSKYVNAKRLIAGDSVVFMRKKSTNELFVGVRRAERFGGEAGLDSGEALAAIESAVRGRAFEVVYYPKAGSPDFVVAAEKVYESTRTPWAAGMRVRMAVEADDSSRMTWIQGVVTMAARPAAGLWCGSPWRMLQVTWDEVESSESVQKVSPWEVEYIALAPLMDPEFPPSKRLKLLQESGMLPGGSHDEIFCIPPPMSRSHDPSMPVFNYNSHQPAPIFQGNGGMQGARQQQQQQGQGEYQLPAAVSTELSIAMNSYREQLGSSAAALHSHPSTSTASTSSSSSSSTFQLFGKTIQASSSSCRCATGGELVCKCNA